MNFAATDTGFMRGWRGKLFRIPRLIKARLRGRWPSGIRPRVIMNNGDGLGNRMIRFMLAHRISEELGGWPLVHYNLAEWGIVNHYEQARNGRGLATGRGNHFDINAIVRRAVEERVDYVEVNSWGMRAEYFEQYRAHFARVFAAPPGHPIADDEIAINVRTGDIIDGFHADYTPLPLAFYHRILAETGLRPVFVGQLQDNWYVRALRAQFPDARYLTGSPLEDFQTLRGAQNLIVAVSTFSWLAAWLSDQAQVIHMPLAGLFNPLQRSDVDLRPKGDPRWRFHQFAPSKFLADDAQKAIMTSLVARPCLADEQPSYLGYCLDPQAPG